MFDYLAVLISVVLGLAVTHALTGASEAINRRRTVTPDWMQLFWALNVVLYVLALWWGMYWWHHLTSWTVQTFFFLTGYAVILFLLSSALFPGEAEGGFIANRRWFFGLLIAAHLLDIPETAAKQLDGLRAVPTPYLIVAPAFLTIAAAGWWSPSRRVHAVLAPAWLAVLISYEVFSSLERIVSS